MLTFTDRALIVPFRTRERKPRWRTVHGFSAVNAETGKEIAYVPAGYVSDLASVPWPATLILPKAHPDYTQAAILHDWCLEHERARYSRKAIDAMFRDALKSLENPPIRSWLIFQGVSIFGRLVEQKRYHEPSPSLGRNLDDDFVYSFEQIGKYRDVLDDIDRTLIAMIASRLVIADKIGEIKAYKGLPPEDLSREREQDARYKELAGNYGVAAHVVCGVLDDLRLRAKVNHAEIAKAFIPATDQ